MTEIKLPQMGESIFEGTVSVWLVDVGQRIEADAPLVTVSTDKADIDIPSPVTGVLIEITAKEGQTIQIGQLLGRIDETRAAVEADEVIPGEQFVIMKTPEQLSDGHTTELPAPRTMPGSLTAKPAGEDISAWLMPVPAVPPPPIKEGFVAAEAMRTPDRTIIAPPEIKHDESCEDDGENCGMNGFYSPAVMRLAIERGVDLATIRGTGHDGRVTKGDVMHAVPRARPAGGAGSVLPATADIHDAAIVEDEPGEPPLGQLGLEFISHGGLSEVSTEAEPAHQPSSDAAEGFGTYSPAVYDVEPGDSLTEFTRLRRLIADHMVYSKHTAAHVTTFAEVDMKTTAAHRDVNKAAFRAEHCTGLTYLPYVVFAAMSALKEYPLMNSVVQAGKILTKRSLNIGVAVDSERGLLVPVIHNADGMGITRLAININELSVKVRDRKVLPNELTGGTFTVSNPGKNGNLFGTPVISQPQVGILRMGEVTKRAVVIQRDGEDAIVVRPMMYLSLSYDHRVVDGLTANEFLHRVKEHIEEGGFVM